MSAMVITAPKAHAVNLGPFKVAKDFCEKVQALTPILNVYSMVQWPVIGFPGISMGLTQNTSALLDLCNFVMQIEQLDTQDAIFFAGATLNKMTDNKWNHHLEMADKTWNLANTVYDFDEGQFKKGTLESVQTHRDINDYMATSYSWYHKTFNGKEAQLKNRDQRERDMNDFAGVAYKRAILQEALSCPGGSTADKDYEKVYTSEIQPWEVKRDAAQDDINFFRSKLMDMGPRFMNGQGDLDEYVKGIEQLMVSGVDYQITTKKKTETTMKPGPVDKKTGKPVQTKVNVSRNTQVFQARIFSDMFQKFRNKYTEDWSSWVTAQFVSRGTEGMLNDPRGKVEDEFRDLAYECQENRLMRGFSSDRPDYQKVRDERMEKCSADTRINQKKAENLFSYYMVQFQDALYKLKQANANIWTKESWYLGTTRSVNSKNSSEGFQQEEISCGQNLEPAEMQKLSLKQQGVENEYSEMQAKQLLKQTTMMEMQAKSEKDVSDENQKRKAYAQNQQKKNVRDLKQQIIPVPVSGGF